MCNAPSSINSNHVAYYKSRDQKKGSNLGEPSHRIGRDPASFLVPYMTAFFRPRFIRSFHIYGVCTKPSPTGTSCVSAASGWKDGLYCCVLENAVIIFGRRKSRGSGTSFGGPARRKFRGSLGITCGPARLDLPEYFRQRGGTLWRGTFRGAPAVRPIAKSQVS